MTQLFTTIASLRDYLRNYLDTLKSEQPCGQVTVGLVPTMGALHVGHLSLIDRARTENACVVVSIFVNPLQFGAGEDFEQYPRTLASDRQSCESAGVDALCAPNALEMGVTSSSMTQVMPPPEMINI